MQGRDCDNHYSIRYYITLTFTPFLYSPCVLRSTSWKKPLSAPPQFSPRLIPSNALHSCNVLIDDVRATKGSQEFRERRMLGLTEAETREETETDKLRERQNYVWGRPSQTNDRNHRRVSPISGDATLAKDVSMHICNSSQTYNLHLALLQSLEFGKANVFLSLTKKVLRLPNRIRTGIATDSYHRRRQRPML